MHFRDRTHAGFLLGQALAHYGDEDRLIVLGLPRGGVPVAAEVARMLHAPLHVLVVRKIGHPYNPEVAVGAVSEFGTVLGDASQTKTISDEYREARRRRTLYEPSGLPSLKDNTVILVDDGIATGYTMQLAVEEVRRLGARHVAVVTPVAPREVGKIFRRLADEFITLYEPENFLGVGAYYDQFPQLEDDEVTEMLTQSETGSWLQSASPRPVK